MDNSSVEVADSLDRLVEALQHWSSRDTVYDRKWSVQWGEHRRTKPRQRDNAGRKTGNECYIAFHGESVVECCFRCSPFDGKLRSFLGLVHATGIFLDESISITCITEWMRRQTLMILARPKSAIFTVLFSPTRTFRAARSKGNASG